MPGGGFLFSFFYYFIFLFNTILSQTVSPWPGSNQLAYTGRPNHTRDTNRWWDIIIIEPNTMISIFFAHVFFMVLFFSVCCCCLFVSFSSYFFSICLMTDILVTNDFFAFIKDLFSRTTYIDNPCYIYMFKNL